MRSSPPIPALSLSLSLSLADINNVRGQSVRRPAGRRCGHGASLTLHPVALCGHVERRQTAVRRSLSLSLSLSC